MIFISGNRHAYRSCGGNTRSAQNNTGRICGTLSFPASGLILLILSLLSGCAVNPVTGERELSLVSTQQEIAIGEEQYGPARQMQGGDYVVDPGLTAYVQSVGRKLAAVSDRPGLPYEFTVLDNPVPNAWALPGGKIAVNRGLLTELDNEAQLAAVLAHEIVHAAARHGARELSRSLLLQTGAQLLAAGAADSEYAGLVSDSAALGAALIGQRYSREAELEADRYGMRYMARAGYDPRTAVELQKTFLRLAREAGQQSDWLEGLFASHPPSTERIAANRRTAEQLGATGRLGRETWQRQTAELRAAQPAYRAYRAGLAALQAGRFSAALEQAQQALAIEPEAPAFHALQGAALLESGRPEPALDAYNAALRRKPDYFQYHLGRGLALAALERNAEARTALERANSLLPTARAHEALGDLARERGDLAAAREHYRIAAQSESGAGRRAREKLAQLPPPGP